MVSSHLGMFLDDEDKQELLRAHACEEGVGGGTRTFFSLVVWFAVYCSKGRVVHHCWTCTCGRHCGNEAVRLCTSLGRGRGGSRQSDISAYICTLMMLNR
jgi:hypothetical protein